MPISYHIDSDARLVRTVASGVVADADLRAHEDLLASDPAFDSTMGQFIDGRQIERLDVSAEGIRQFVTQEGSRHAERFANHRVAILATENGVYGMARMYQTLSSLRVGVFRTMVDAMAFLGRSPVES